MDVENETHVTPTGAKMDRPKVYLESSVISYLTARPSEMLAQKFRQEQTKLWWEGKDRYELFISETVWEEIRLGDLKAAQLRMDAVSGISVLRYSEQIDLLAQTFLSAGALPLNAAQDAYHIAYTAIHQIDYLLTWNQKHIANPAKRRQIEELIFGFQLQPPLLVTPEQLLNLKKPMKEET